MAFVITLTRTLAHGSPGRDPCTGVTRRSSGLAGFPEWVPRAATARSKSEVAGREAAPPQESSRDASVRSTTDLSIFTEGSTDEPLLHDDTLPGYR